MLRSRSGGIAIVTRSEFLKKRSGKDNTKLPFMTAKDLADSGLAGMWKDRKDIRSTAQFSRKLRDRLSKDRQPDCDSR
jgi:hypothetical protein